jgi:hypothetical protein
MALSFIPIILYLVYFGCIVAIIICLLRLMGRLVIAIERGAAALEIIARKQQNDGKP